MNDDKHNRQNPADSTEELTARNEAAATPADSSSGEDRQPEAAEAQQDDPYRFLTEQPGSSNDDGAPPAPEGSSSGEESEEQRPIVPTIIQWFKDLVLAAAICLLLITYVVQPFKVEKTSMEPLLHDSDRILVSKISLWFEPIKRGDIVVLVNPRNTSESWIKRVIALPGETVQMDNGYFFINGVRLDEEYIPEIERTAKNFFPPENIVRFADDFLGRNSPSEDTFEEFGIVYMDEWETDASFNIAMRVPEGYYFVAGDHRRYSMDSRDSVFIRNGNGPGLIPKNYIYGKAVFRYWPLEDIGVIPHPVYEDEE